jgi:hypothetical protein
MNCLCLPSVSVMMFALCTAVSAADVSKQYAIGYGNERCTQWTSSVTNLTDFKSPHAQWLLGAVSGHNFFYYPSEGSVFLESDSENLLRRFGAFCVTNPERKLYESVADFFRRDLETVYQKRKP